MLSPTLHLLVNNGLWLLLTAGWVFLLTAGLEADKPLSGGIPGHVEPGEDQPGRPGLADRVGEVGAWLIFGLAASSLPGILWWIWATHPG
jgi:hypothetical protein